MPEHELAGNAIAIFSALKNRKQTVATAESCTAGFIAYLLTSSPGASDVYKQGWVLYQEESKRKDFAMLASVEVYSNECAKYLAEEARIRAGTDWGIGITGLADEGRVWVAISFKDGTIVYAYNGMLKTKTSCLPVDERREIRHKMTGFALSLFREILQV